jgi:uncharacterized protein (DUF2141 family)
MTRTLRFDTITRAAGAATLAAAIAVIGLAAGPARAAGDARIEATVSGVSNAPGLVGCALFGSPTGFPLQSRKHALTTLRVTPVNGTARCVFERIAPGDYAIAVVHDANGNEEADTNLLGMPTEGVGVSNNVLPRMTAPTFEASRFTVAVGQTARLAISMRY